MTASRSDALRNRDRIVEVARVVVQEQGTQASLRDVARRAEVGLGTLYRHFPSRDALLEQLLHKRFEFLAARAEELAKGVDAGAALDTWLIEFIYALGAYRGLPGSVMAVLKDDDSPLHPGAAALREATGRMLAGAQAAGDFRDDLTVDELFDLAAGIGWIVEQAPEPGPERERLLDLMVTGLLRGSPRSAP